MVEAFLMQGLLFLMGVSIFTSKSGMTLFGFLLLVLSLIPKNFTLIKNKKIMWLVASLFPLAMLTNAFSLGGHEAVMKVIQAFPWPLMVIPSALVVERRDLRKFLFYGLLLGLVLGIGKTFWNLHSLNVHQIGELARVTGFWDISRWGVFTGVAIISIFWLLSNPIYIENLISGKIKRRSDLSLFILFFLTLICLVLTAARAPWLGTFFGIAILFFTSKRAKKITLGVFALVLVIAMFIPSLRERIASVASVKTENGKITSSDLSNAGRLHMWKVALDFYKEQPFFGTGLELAEAPFRVFLAKQSDEYRTKYTTVEFSYHDQHSTYFGMLVKMGIIFSLLFWMTIAYLGYLSFKNRNEAIQNWLILSLLGFHLVVFIFYTSFDSYEMITFFPLFAWLQIKKSSLSDNSFRTKTV